MSETFARLCSDTAVCYAGKVVSNVSESNLQQLKCSCYLKRQAIAVDNIQVGLNKIDIIKFEKDGVNVDDKNKVPLWVMLAFSSIKTRKGALILIALSILFTVYCVPWSIFFGAYAWVGKIFLIDNWSWAAMMIPIVAWYLLCLKWMDVNRAWEAHSEL